MSDEPLDDLARLARERREPLDPRWEALARGELDEAERAALLASDDAARLAPLFEPLGDDFADALTARLLGATPAESPDAPTTLHDLPVVDPDEPTSENVVPLHPAPGPRATAPEATAPEATPTAPATARPWLRVAAPLVALAAAALLAVGTLRGSDPLPAYALEVQGGDQLTRAPAAPAADVLRLSPGSRVTLVARPAEEVATPVVAEARIVRTAGAPLPWGGAVEVSPSGAVRLTGTLGAELQLPPGEAVIEVTVHPRGAPDEAQTLSTPVLVVE